MISDTPCWLLKRGNWLSSAGALPAFESDDKAFGTMAAAPFGSSLILPISYAYIAMMGSEGLTEVRCRMAPFPASLHACSACRLVMSTGGCAEVEGAH